MIAKVPPGWDRDSLPGIRRAVKSRPHERMPTRTRSCSRVMGCSRENQLSRHGAAAHSGALASPHPEERAGRDRRPFSSEAVLSPLSPLCSNSLYTWQSPSSATALSGAGHPVLQPTRLRLSLQAVEWGEGWELPLAHSFLVPWRPPATKEPPGARRPAPAR